MAGPVLRVALYNSCVHAELQFRIHDREEETITQAVEHPYELSWLSRNG
jgi:hypothetical protein